ncbi:hypothetical protein XW81_01370 [Buchnera aphidicola (Schlechtendalia chinensis)]|uniref:6-phosphogluconolactonase n=1 Tax=Buchnera aphidicola subsp. Schlechtendalia chinensis TaxID=118110 RepID=A0A172WDK6_BUCSC|nr:beta-propeller fold lactonase family protein [Buchnera aphidicola]ANF17054.1 hypothetical protein XW81_01370 [Buchnera aphidicola (Schlechtendalia chinensis)]
MKNIVYVSSANSQQIEVWELNPDSSLYLIQILKLKGEPQPILISSDKKRLYVGIRPKFRICSHIINSNGTLEEIGYSNISFSVNHFSINESETHLFSSSYHYNCINVSPIDSSGFIHPVIQTINEIKGCHSSLVYNKNVFVSSLKDNRIYLYNFTKEGILVEHKKKFISFKKNCGPRHIIFQKNMNRLFSINEIDGTLSILNVSSLCNRITFKKNIDIIPNKNQKPAWSSDIHISPCTKFLYASDRGNNSITILKNHSDINSIKILGYVQTEVQPRSFDISKNGKNLIVAGELSNSISVYDRNKVTGFLKLKNRYPTGNRPVWISIHEIS